MRNHLFEKKIVFLLLFILFHDKLFSFTMKNQGSDTKNDQYYFQANGKLLLAPDHPDLDSNWKWYEDNPVEIFIDYKHYFISLPYFSNSISNSFFQYGTKFDYKPEDGWVLFLRRFDARVYQTPFACYVLYNKYRGILRFIIHFGYDLPGIDGKRLLIGKLKIVSDDKVAIFSMNNIDKHCYLNDSPYEINAMSFYLVNDWNVLDFNVAGFDPTIYNKKVLVEFSIYFVDVEREEPLLNYVGIYDNQATFFNYQYDLYNGTSTINNINAEWKSWDGIKNGFIEMKKKLNRLPSGNFGYFSELTNAVNNTIPGEWFDVAATFAGIFKTFIAGGNTGNDLTSIFTNFSYKLELDDKFMDSEPVGKFQFYLPGSNFTQEEKNQLRRWNLIPLYNKPLGLFNLKYQPFFQQNKNYSSIFAGDSRKGFGEIYLRNFSCVFNNSIFKDIKVQFSPVSETQNISKYKDLNEFYSYNFADYFLPKNFKLGLKVKLLVKDEEKPNNTNENFIEPHIIKTFEIPVKISNKLIYTEDNDDNSGNIIISRKQDKNDCSDLSKSLPQMNVLVNPFNPYAKIRIKLHEDSKVSFSIYNMLGQKIYIKDAGYLLTGNYSFKIDMSNMASGNYIIVAQFEGERKYRIVKKVVFLK